MITSSTTGSDREKKDDKPKVDVQVISLGESSVNLRAWCWAATYVTGFRMRNDLLKSIKLRFDAEGVEIPFPHRTLVHKNMPPFVGGEEPVPVG